MIFQIRHKPPDGKLYDFFTEIMFDNIKNLPYSFIF